jgi:hypothetical protein
MHKVKRKRIRLQDLSPGALDVVRAKRAAGLNRLGDWLKLLDEVELFDAETVEKRRKAIVRAGIVGIFLVISLIGLIVAHNESEGAATFFVLTILVLVFGLLLAYLIVRIRRIGAMDLADDFKRVLIPFLRTMSDDISPKKKVRLNLDLSGPVKSKIVRKAEVPPGRFRKVVETVYADPWCRLDAPMAEGSRLFLNIRNTYTVCHRRWKTSRGKYKSKKKWKKLVVVSAGIAPNAEKYRLELDGVDAAAQARNIKFKVARKKDGRLAILQRKFKFSSVNKTPDQYVELDEMVRMFFQLGSIMKPL